MAIKRIVSTEFWTDRKVVETFTPEDRFFMIYLLTNPHTTQLGIYQFVSKIAAFEIGYGQESITTLIDRFERIHDVVRFSNKTGEIAIKNYLKHSIVKGGTPVYDLLMKEAKAVKDKTLLAYVLDANTNNTNETVRAFVAKAHELLNDNDNDNDNDNEDSCPNRARIVDESSKPSKVKEVQHKYGLYNNVLLSDTDLAKVKNEFPDWQERIERLSEYMASKGTAYKNHLATIRVWAKKDREKQPKQAERKFVVMSD